MDEHSLDHVTHFPTPSVLLRIRRLMLIQRAPTHTAAFLATLANLFLPDTVRLSFDRDFVWLYFPLAFIVRSANSGAHERRAERRIEPMRFQPEARGKTRSRISCSCARRNRAISVGAESGIGSGVQCCGSRTNRSATGRRISELHQLGRKRDRSGGCRWRGARGCRVVADRARLWPLAIRCRSTVGDLRCHPANRVLDHQRNRRGDLDENSKP